MTKDQKQKLNNEYKQVYNLKKRLYKMTYNEQYYLTCFYNIKIKSLRHNLNTSLKNLKEVLNKNNVNDYIIICENNKIKSLIVNNKVKMNLNIHKYVSLNQYTSFYNKQFPIKKRINNILRINFINKPQDIKNFKIIYSRTKKH